MHCWVHCWVQVGGYLGYVGYFCLAAGIGLGSSVEINTFASWAHLLTAGG
jgi:SulP family sulfate permease